KSSRLVRDHLENPPPSVEICRWPPGPGNGRTYTSLRPVSVDWYAIQRPSGENIGSVLMKGLLRYVMGLPGFHPDVSSPSIGRIIKSKPVCEPCSSKVRNLPLGCQEAGSCRCMLSVRRFTSPVPSARCQ